METWEPDGQVNSGVEILRFRQINRDVGPQSRAAFDRAKQWHWHHVPMSVNCQRLLLAFRPKMCLYENDGCQVQFCKMEAYARPALVGRRWRQNVYCSIDIPDSIVKMLWILWRLLVTVKLMEGVTGQEGARLKRYPKESTELSFEMARKTHTKTPQLYLTCT
jgi:hypothetical protein